MREIKFRGKRFDTREWVYGSLINYSQSMSYIVVGLLEYETCSVLSDTVGQYTGLKDKNDVDIYEGDILLYIDCDTKKPCKTIVRFDDGTFWNSDMYFKADMSTFEIIGNIHDKEGRENE